MKGANSIYKTLGASNHTDHLVAVSHCVYCVLHKLFGVLIRRIGHYIAIKANVLFEKIYTAAAIAPIDKVSRLNVVSMTAEHFGKVPLAAGALPNEVVKILDLKQQLGGFRLCSVVVVALPLIVMFLKLQFLEGKARRALFDTYPPKCVYVASGRIQCAKNGDFERMKAGGGSAIAFAWFVWQKGYTGDTVVKWIN